MPQQGSAQDPQRFQEKMHCICAIGGTCDIRQRKGGMSGERSVPADFADRLRVGVRRALACVNIWRMENCGIDAENTGPRGAQFDDSLIGETENEGVVEMLRVAAADKGRESGLDKVKKAVACKRLQKKRCVGIMKC